MQDNLEMTYYCEKKHVAMSKSSKIILGVLTFLPILFFVAYFISIFSIIKSVAVEGVADPSGMAFVPNSVYAAMIWMGIAILMTLGLWVYYIIHIVKNSKFNTPTQSSSKLIWILVVVFGGVLGMIVYYFVEVLPEGKQEALLQ